MRSQTTKSKLTKAHDRTSAGGTGWAPSLIGRFTILNTFIRLNQGETDNQEQCSIFHEHNEI